MSDKLTVECKQCGKTLEANDGYMDQMRLHQWLAGHKGLVYHGISYEGLPLANEWSKHPYVQVGQVGKK